MVTRTNES